MKEHTVTKIRSMLSTEDMDTLSALKAQERHKHRDLSEAGISKSRIMMRLMNKDKMFTKSYWKDVAQLVVHGEIDPQNMKPLFAPKTASALEKLGAVSPRLMKGVIGGLRGLKKLKHSFGDARIKKHHTAFDINDPSYDDCSDKYSVGSSAYYKCMSGEEPHHRSSGGYSGDLDNIDRMAKHNRRLDRLGIGKGGSSQGKLTLRLPSNTKERRHAPQLQQEVEDALLKFGNVRKLAQAIAKLRK